MATTPVDMNPIEGLYSQIYTMVDGMIVKFSGIADSKETFETRKYFDGYYDALMGYDTFYSYSYTPEEYIAAGIMNPAVYNNYIDHPVSTPDGVKNILLENRRKAIIDEYNEPNDYYRELAGLPPIDTVGAHDVTKIVTNSFLVVDDTSEIEIDEKKIKLSSARKIMNSDQIYVNDYIYIGDVSFQKIGTSKSRSFEIIDDCTEYDAKTTQIHFSDALTIVISLGLEFNIYVSGYLYIDISAIQKTTTVIHNSFLVVDDNEPDYDTNTMIKLSEAKTNIPSISVDSYLLRGNFVYPTMEMEETYGVSRKVPVHALTRYYGNTQYSTIMESLGYLDEQLTLHPDYTYLKYIGMKNIPVEKARKAKNFELLHLPMCDREILHSQFVILYNGCRDYFVNTVYNYYYCSIYDMYDNFIALSICSMTISQLLARTGEMAINREFYDERMVQMLYESYNIPYCSTLNYNTQRRLVKNLNKLIQDKGENKVLYDIAYLLGYHDISIYKYYLVKERKYDTDDNLIYADTTKIDLVVNENNELVEKEVVVNDLEEMYDVYFQKVELNETNYNAALSDKSKRVNYNTLTDADPLWWDDDDTWSEVYGDPTKFTEITEPDIYHKHYNYTETKYLGITISYKMSELLYENIMLLRMIFDKKDELSGVFVTFPKLTGSLQVSVFDCVVFLCALISKRYGLSGEILTKVSSTLNCIGYMTIDADGYIPCDTVAFNFEKVTNLEVFNDIIKQPLRYLSVAEAEEFRKYFEWITLPQTTEAEKVKIFNEMYQNIKGLGYYVGRKMSEAETYPEYTAWRDLYESLFIVKEAREMFTIGATETVAKTYAEYLQVMNPPLFEIVNSVDENTLYSDIDHVIYSLEQVVNGLKSLYTVNDSNSTVHDYLIKLVKFFKSYTTDLVDLTTQYIFDLKPDNLFKLSEYYKMHKVIISREAYRMMYSDIATTIVHMKKFDEYKFSEFIALSKTIPCNDSMKYTDSTGDVSTFGLRNRTNMDKADISALEHAVKDYNDMLLRMILDSDNDISTEAINATSSTITLVAMMESLYIDELGDANTIDSINEIIKDVSDKCITVCGVANTKIPLSMVNTIIQEVNRILDPNTRTIRKNDVGSQHSYTDEISVNSTLSTKESMAFTDSVIITSKNS